MKEKITATYRDLENWVEKRTRLTFMSYITIMLLGFFFLSFLARDLKFVKNIEVPKKPIDIIVNMDRSELGEYELDIIHDQEVDINLIIKKSGRSNLYEW